MGPPVTCYGWISKHILMKLRCVVFPKFCAPKFSKKRKSRKPVIGFESNHALGRKNAKHLWRSRFGRLKESARVRPRPLHQRLHESLPPKRNDCRVAPLFPRKKISSRWIGRGGSCELGSSSCYFERFILAVAFCGCSLELSPGAVLSPPCLTPAIVANRKNIRAVTCWHVWALIFANEWLIVFYS